MGTYTANKELYMPTVGETGWGTLVNGNFETIDNFLKPITVSGSTYTFTGNQTGGSISATSISNSGTLTQTGTSTFTGKITGNGGIGTTSLTTSSTITSTGKITANGGIGTTSLTTSSTITSTGVINANGGIIGYISLPATLTTSNSNATSWQTESEKSVSVNPTASAVTFYTLPKLTKKEYIWDYVSKTPLSRISTNSVSVTRTITITGLVSTAYWNQDYFKAYIYRDGVQVGSWANVETNSTKTPTWYISLSMPIDNSQHVYTIYVTHGGNNNWSTSTCTIKISGFTIYIKKGYN